MGLLWAAACLALGRGLLRALVCALVPQPNPGTAEAPAVRVCDNEGARSPSAAPGQSRVLLTLGTSLVSEESCSREEP